MKQTIFLLFIFSFLFSCGASKEEEVKMVIDEANYYLSSMDCASAKETLDSVTYQDDNAEFVSLYSAVYACEAGYTVLGTVYDNLINISATAAGLFRSLANFNSSNETAADSAVYSNLKLAISEILKNSNGTVARLAKYGATKGTDLSMQLLYMTLTEMGKYLAYYGNKGAVGDKGGGGGGNGCMMNYNNAAVTPLLALNGADTCAAIGDGSTDLDPVDPDFIQRACEGIVLHNVFGDIITNVNFSTHDDLGDLDDTGTVYTTFLTAALLAEPDIANYQDFQTFAACEAYAVLDLVELQRVFSVYVESLYQ